jgi:ribonuclease P protein component
MARLETLKKRSEFQRVRGGGRYASPAFVLEGRLRTGEQLQRGPRFGFTITKKLGNAVVRNRIRRRLKAVLAGSSAAMVGVDYVIVAREIAANRPFTDLKQDFEVAFDRVHRALAGEPQKPRNKPSRRSP